MKFQFILLLIILLSCEEHKSLPAVSNTNAYYEKAWFHMDQNNKDSAFAFLNKAKIEFAKNKDSIGMAKCMMNMAIIQADYGDFMGSQENAVDAVKSSREPVTPIIFQQITTSWEPMSKILKTMKSLFYI